jgi:L-alanine-DL-glutamate epimerase-like enolase superfamily enzyme
MRHEVAPLTLPLKTPFRIAHGTSTVRENVLVRLGDGRGEAAVVPYYGYSRDEIVAYLAALDPATLWPSRESSLENALDRLPPGPPPARAAADMALHDHWARQLGHPLYRLWGLDPARAPASSFTLSIPDDETALRAQVRAATDCPILKLKLGTGDLEADVALVRIVREETRATLCVDANGAWDLETATEAIARLGAYDVQFIEQPIPAGDAAAWHRLRSALPRGVPPLIADESVQGPEDVLALAGAADGINIKLAKAGGLRAARQMIAIARALGLRIMLGCMIESAVAVTAAAHLAPLADFADLDGPLHLAHDPFSGVRLASGHLVLPRTPGLGVLDVQ